MWGTRVSRDRGICFLLRRIYFTPKISRLPRIRPRRVAFLATFTTIIPAVLDHPTPPLRFFPYFSNSRWEFLLRHGRNLRIFIFLFSTRSRQRNVFFFFLVNQDVTNNEVSRDEYRRGEKRQENRATTDCASSCKPTGQMQCTRCNIYASSEEGIHCSNKAWKSYQF